MIKGRALNDGMNIKNVKAIEKMTAFDARTLHWVISHPNAPVAAIWARKVSRLGDGPLYALVGALAAWLGGELGREFLAHGLLAFLIELPLYLALKNTIRRSRPADAHDALLAFIKPSDKFSFPSGHTAAAFVMACIVIAYMPPLAVLVLPLAVSIGASRVALGVHYPTDIVAGMVLGCSAASLALYLL